MALGTVNVGAPKTKETIDAKNVILSNGKNMEETMKTVTEELEQGGAGQDWAQNDESAADFIKNRTHWAEPPVTTNTVCLEEGRVTLTDGEASVRIAALPEEGDIVRVIWDGQTYECVCESYVLGWIAGNKAKLSDTGDTGEPFLLHLMTDGEPYTTIYTVAEETGEVEHTVGISFDHTTQVLHPLDQRFVPNADWSAAEGEDGFIENKPTLTKTYTATLYASKWKELDDGTGVKYYPLTIGSKVTEDSTAKVDVRYTGDGSSESYATFVEQQNQFLEYVTNGYGRTANLGMYLYIFGDAPTIDIPIVIEVS